MPVQYVIDRRSEAHSIPEIARTSMVDPVPPPLNARESTTKSPSAIGLAIGKYALRRYFTSNDGVHMTRPDMYRVRDPSTMCAYGPNGFQSNKPGFRVEPPRCLIQMRLPPPLSARVRCPHWAARKAVLCIDPTLFRSWQVCAVGRER